MPQIRLRAKPKFQDCHPLWDINHLAASLHGLKGRGNLKHWKKLACIDRIGIFYSIRLSRDCTL
jgi:hypothetical protein